MKVAELKEKVQGCTEDQLKRIIVEIYKAIPKSVKEDQGIDALILNRGAMQKQSKRPARVEMDALRAEMEQFLSNAYNQYYYIPNKVVSKRERPGWRFTARRLFKQLNQAVGEPDHSLEAAEQLQRLYKMLCYSCSYVLFSAYDTFESVGVSQVEFYRATLTAMRKVKPPKRFVRDSILLALANSLNRYTLYDNLLQVLVAYLDTADMKGTAIEVCDAVREEINAGPLEDRKKNVDNIEDHQTKKFIRNLALLGWMCFMELGLPEDAIRYFRKHYAEKDPEIALYVLLRMIGQRGDWDLWIKTYQESVDSGVQPREELQRLYKETRKKANQAQVEPG